MIFEIQILAWDVIKPVNGIPTLLITGSPTAVYIYKYDKKKNAQIRFHSKKKNAQIRFHSKRLHISCITKMNEA
jgi:hypothetical protein